MIKKFALGIVLLLALVVGYAALQPAEYLVKREITISAPPEKVWPHLNNQKLAEKWGPWLEVDPQAKMNYSGPDEGVGAKTNWDSSGELGTGSATIVESVPHQRVGIQLDYVKPMNMQQFSTYLLEGSGTQSKVTWQVTGRNSLPGRVMCLFFDMDKMVGGMFEKGLSNLKTLVESQGSTK